MDTDNNPELLTESRGGDALGRRRLWTGKVRLIIAFCTTLATFGVLECAARVYVALKKVPRLEIVSPWQSGMYQPHPYLGFVLRPNYVRVSNEQGDVQINSLGFRGSETTLKKPPGTVRLVCLGGSTTFCVRIGNEYTYPRQLEAKLRDKYPGRQIEVINAGVPSYTSADSVVNLCLRVLDLEPDILVDYDGLNDVYPRMIPGFKSDYSHWRRGDVIPVTPVADCFARYSMLFAGLRYRSVRNRANMFERAFYYEDFSWIPPDELLDNLETVSSATFRRNIETIVHIAKARGIQVVLSTFICNERMTQGAETSPKDKAFVSGITEHNYVMRTVSEEERCLLVDVAGEFPKSNEELFNGSFHMNSRGTSVMAQILCDAIVSAGLIE